jgi:hypothetical protein
LSGIQKELGPKGFQPLEAAINEHPDVPGFVKTFKPSFPVGIADGVQARNYLQLGPTQQAFVPLLVMIDRQGNIRYQHTGGEQQYFDEDLIKQALNLRGEIDKLLAEGQKPARPAAQKKRTAAKK